jgi:hypothetical protein
MADAGPGITGPGNGERERGSRGRRSAAPGTYQTVCGELIPTTNRPGAADPRPPSSPRESTCSPAHCRALPTSPHRASRSRSSAAAPVTDRPDDRRPITEAGQVASASRRLCRHALRGRNESRQVPSLSRWTHENGSPSRLPITHHARRDPALIQPDDPPRPLGPAFTQPGGGIGPCRCGLPLPAPFTAADRRVASRFALFGRFGRPSPEKSAHSPLPGVSWGALRRSLGGVSGASRPFGRVRRFWAREAPAMRRCACFRRHSAIRMPRPALGRASVPSA